MTHCRLAHLVQEHSPESLPRDLVDTQVRQATLRQHDTANAMGQGIVGH